MKSSINPALQAICSRLVKQDNAHIAAGIVDLDTAMVLAAYHEVEYFSDAYVETVMEASVNMFRGPVMEEIDELVSAQRNLPFSRNMEEVYFRTPHTHHFLCIPENTCCLLILVTSIHAGREMGWQLAHKALPEIAPHCPPPLTDREL